MELGDIRKRLTKEIVDSIDRLTAELKELRLDLNRLLEEKEKK